MESACVAPLPDMYTSDVIRDPAVTIEVITFDSDQPAKVIEDLSKIPNLYRCGIAKHLNELGCTKFFEMDI